MAKKFTKEELISRAKILYFDKNPKIKAIFANEFGQFSFRNGDLEEINKHREIDIYEISRDQLKSFTPKKVNDFSKKDDIEKNFKKDEKKK